MKPITQSLRVLYCLALSMALPLTAAPQELDPTPRQISTRPDEIRGTVRLNGLAVDGSQIRIQAQPMGVRSSDGRRFGPDPRAVPRTVALNNTADRGVFTFTVTGLQPATLYRLSIETAPNAQPSKIFWRGTMDGLSMSGGPPVEIEGFAARTEVEILDSEGEWVGMDDLQFTNPDAALRSLRWRSTVPGVVEAELQISTRAFPVSGAIDPCGVPERGLIHSARISGRGGDWQTISDLDFGEILRPGGRSPGDEVIDRTSPSGDVPEDIPGDETDRGESSTAPVTEEERRLLEIGAPIYVRVVPVTTAGRACDVREVGVHGWVILSKLAEAFDTPEESQDAPVLTPWASAYTPPRLTAVLNGTRYPTLGGELVYRVIKEHTLPWCVPLHGKCPYFSNDPLGSWILDIGIYPPSTKLAVGQVFVIFPGSSGGGGLLSTIGDLATGLVTGVVGFAGDVVSIMSEISESVKNGVAKVVADVVTDLPLIGAACNAVASCEDVIKMGINYGLTSMGIPPSIPNWNELKDQGLDYLAAEIASEMSSATGLPDAVTQLLADQAMDQVMTVAKGMAEKTIDMMTENLGSENPAGYDWVVPYLGIDPAVFTVWIRKDGSDPLPSNLYLRTQSDGLYMHGSVRVPKVFPTNNELRIPIVLQPDYSTIAAPLCRWKGQMVCGPHPFGLKKPTCEAASYNWNTHQWEWKPSDCTYWRAVDVYYRDAWIDGQLNTAPCTNLVGSMFTMTPTLWFPFYPPYLSIGRFDPTQNAFWPGAFYVQPGCQ